MTTNTRHLIPLTDDRGKALLPDDEMSCPLPGSVVLTSGAHGTAWQRHFSDGAWYSTHGSRREWSDLLRHRNLVLVYEAAPRTTHDTAPRG